MGHPVKLPRISLEDYLATEKAASSKHEYVDGQVFAMTGVTKRHNKIALNIAMLLRSHVRGTHCSAYVSDVKVRVEATNSFYYPDVMVACDKSTLAPSDEEDDVYAASPVLLIEVLSRSTATIDRREKLLAYKQIPSLREYLIVYQSRSRAELHRRNGAEWDTFEFAEGTTLQLLSMPTGALEFPIDAIYEDAGATSSGDLTVRETAHEEAALADW